MAWHFYAMVKNWLPVAALSLVGISLLSGARKAEAAKYLSGSIGTPKVVSLGLMQTRLSVPATITNPGAVDIPFDALNCQLFLNGQQFASVVKKPDAGRINLKAFTDTTLWFDVTLSNGSVLNTIKQAIKTGWKNLKIDANGNVYSGVLLIPFSTTYALSTPAAVKGFFRRRKRQQPDTPPPEIGKTDVKLQFDTVQEMEDYFSPLRHRGMRISKN